MNLGSYRDYNGRPALRFVLHHPRPTSRVWLSLTDPVRLDRWFPAHVEFSSYGGGTYEGGTVRFDVDGFNTSTGIVLAYEPAQRLGFTFGPDEVWFDLIPDGDSTILAMTMYLADRDMAALNAAGWTNCLSRLELCLAGEEIEDLYQWQDLYDEYVLAGLPADGGIAGLNGLSD